MSFLEGLFWLTLNIYHEARGEPEIGKLAVAHVTLNRAMEQHGSVSQVVNAPNQFSWTFQLDSYLPTDRDALGESFRVALKSLTTNDFTGGATYYHHLNVEPDWAGEMTYMAQFGSHKFYRKSDLITTLPY